MILTSMINALEEREVAIVDIPSAFIQTEVTDKNRRVIASIRGMLVEILVKIAPDVYKDYVRVNKKGELQILVECLNALYGTMMASMLYYEKFTTRLEKAGFKINPYNPCVWNQKIKGKQCTIFFTSTIVKSLTNHQKCLTKSSSGYGKILREYSKTELEI
jgi:hypothetical protein